MCEAYRDQYGCDFISAMPTNLYGPNDNYDLNNSHVLPALIRKFHEAKMNDNTPVELWGTGSPMREFLHVDDMAAACVHVMNLPKTEFERAVPDAMCSHINVGTGNDVTIAELAHTMAKVVGFDGAIEFDATKPDGTPRKLLCVRRLNDLGWAYSVELEQGLAATYEWFLSHLDELRR